MFSPGARTRSRNAQQQQQQQRATDSPTSAMSAAAAPVSAQGIIKHSPTAFRMTPLLKSGDKTAAADGSDPVFVCDFPQQLRTLAAEAPPSQRSEPRGGMDAETGLSWMLHRNKVFVWSHLTTQASADCKALSLPPRLCTVDGQTIDPNHGNHWLVRIISTQPSNEISLVKRCSSASLILCSQKTFTLVYWPDIYRESDLPPILYTVPERRSSSDTKLVSSLIASRSKHLETLAVACCSTGLYRLDCGPSGISHHLVARDSGSPEQSFGPFDFNTSDIGRSLVWRSPAPVNGWQELLLLTSRGLECWDLQHVTGGGLSRAWTYDISEDMEVRKDLTGQKQVWLLDVKSTADKSVTILAASLSKDRVTSSSYMQYSLLTFLCSPPLDRQGGVSTSDTRCMKRKAPAQVILPKARVEEEDFLYSMQLRVGGKPAGSAMILAADGTATISHYLHGVGRLYQFDLAWDAGRVLDASIVPSLDGDEEGAWVVLTEKAGVWAIPEKAVLLGAVEPPERSLSRKGSANDETSKRRISEKSERRVARQRPLQDEEAEATIGRLFQSFLSSRQAAGVFEKLQKTGAFEEEGEMSVFSRFSKSIVDTIAKHWTSGGGAGAAVTMAIASQLAEKQKRHQQYLNFLTATRCHDFLCQRRNTLYAIMEHGEKLAAMLKIKDTCNERAQNDPDNGGALWDVLQLVGETARRKNVMLLDKEKVEVFFTRVSELEDFFACIDEHSQGIIWKGQSVKSITERLCEVSEACTGCILSARQYKDDQETWYPSLEGLTFWYSKPAVRAGLWKVACHLMDLRPEVDLETRERLMGCLTEVTEVLLDGYSGAIEAKVEREEEYRGLQLEYWSRRDSMLAVLQQHDKDFAEHAAQNGEGEGSAEERRFEILRNRYGSLLALARRHAGYQCLWEICIDLNDMECLRNLMHESMGLKEGRFSTFVFEQFLSKGQHAKLLRLGEEFNEDLVSFLQGRKSLSWLHDLYVKRFEVASDTMHSLALSGDQLPVSVTRDQKPGEPLSLAGRQKLLYLAKLSALAAKKRGAANKAIEIDADLGILSVQKFACELGLATSAEVLSPLQLVELCLSSENKELVLRSLEVFALGGDLFRRGNKTLLEAAWLKIADLDDWQKMRRMSEEEAWNDEEQFDALRATALFSAGKYCYGGGAFIVGMPFSDVLPALSEASGLRGVDEVLAEHQDFPEAGEAMVMAMRLGGGLDLLGDDSMDI